MLAVRYRRRAVLALTLMASQAFFYNAIFFTYALMLTRFYGVPEERVGYYIFPFAVGNFLGPLVLGRLFDAVGRRVMIGLTYALSGRRAARHRLCVPRAAGSSAGTQTAVLVGRSSSSPRPPRARPTSR